MKAGWTVKPLAAVCHIKPPKAEARRQISANDLVSFVPMESLGIDQKILVPTQTRPLSEVAGSYTYFANGDVLLAKITPCFENGKLGIATNLVNGIGFGSSEYIVFRPGASVDKEWLYYFLARESFRNEGAERMTGAVGHKRVAKDFIEAYPIPVPPLPEQQRIVTLLDEAFDGIATAKANAEKNLQNARAIFERYLQSVFAQQEEGCAETTLEDCCEQIFAGGDVPKDCVSQERSAKFNVPIFSNGAKDDGLYGFTAIPRVTKPSVTVSARGTIGFSAIRTEPYFPVVRLIVLIPNTILLNLSFLHYRLLGMNFANTGTSIPQLTVPNIKSRTLYLLSLAQQKVMVKNLDNLRQETQRLESIYRQKLAALYELKKSLLHQAFSGQL